MKRSFLSRCIRCGECMKVCPNNALHPTLDEAGLEGLWTPDAGSAHRLLRAQLRALLRGVPHRRHLADHAAGKRLGGRRGARRVSPSAWAPRSTIAAAACPGPRPPSASSARSGARFRPRPSTLKRPTSSTPPATPKRLKQPRVDPSRCVGCGACEYACPLQERPAVYVTSIGESRSPSSQILLNRK